MRDTIGSFTRFDESGFPGGDTVQSDAIAVFLSQHGYQIRRIGFPWPRHPGVDLAVVFNLTRPIEAYLQARYAVSANIPYIVFPVYWDLDSLEMNGTFIDTIKTLLPRPVKNWVRLRKFKTRYPSMQMEQGLERDPNLGHQRRMIQYVLEHAAFVCPNSVAEREHLDECYSLANTSTKVIYNGFYPVDHRGQASAPPDPHTQLPPDYLCCVGAIGPRKNQLNLVRAANETGLHVVIVGGTAPEAERYARVVRESAGSTVHFLGRQPQDMVMGIMARSRGHVQPSYIETPGLASLEAASMGCPIAVSDVAPVREYFQQHALYCQPASVDSIAQVLLNLQHQPIPDMDLIAHVHTHFSWDNVLLPLLEVLQEVDRQCRR